MKNIRTLVFIFSTALFLVSCGKSTESAALSIDEKINQYEQACQAGEFAKAMEIGEDLKQAELTPAQSTRVISATVTGMQVTNKAFKSISDAMPYNYWDVQLDKYEELINQYAALLKQKINGKNVKDQLKKQEEKCEKQEDMLDDAKLTKAQEKRFKKLKDWYDDIED